MDDGLYASACCRDVYVGQENHKAEARLLLATSARDGLLFNLLTYWTSVRMDRRRSVFWRGYSDLDIFSPPGIKREMELAAEVGNECRFLCAVLCARHSIHHDEIEVPERDHTQRFICKVYVLGIDEDASTIRLSYHRNHSSYGLV